MSKQTSIFLTLLLLSSPSWGQLLDYESSFEVGLDNATGMWTLECEIEVDGIVPFEDHRITGSIEYQIAGTTSIFIARSDFDILGSERSKSELTNGQFAFEAKKKGDKLVIGIELSWPAARAVQGEGIGCAINVSKLDNGSPVWLAGFGSWNQIRSVL